MHLESTQWPILFDLYIYIYYVYGSLLVYLFLLYIIIRAYVSYTHRGALHVIACN